MKKIKVCNVILGFMDPRASANYFSVATSRFNGLTESGKKVINVYGDYDKFTSMLMLNPDVIHECNVIEHDRKALPGSYSMRLHNDLFKQFNEDGITISKNIDLVNTKSLYITPQCILPRYKLKDIKEKHDIKITRSVDKASHVVLNESKLLNTFFEEYVYQSADLFTGDELIQSLIKFKAKLNELDPNTFTKNTSLRYTNGYKDLKIVDYVKYINDAIEYIKDLKEHVDFFKLHNESKRVIYIYIDNDKDTSKDYFILSEKGSELYKSILANKPVILSQDAITSTLGETTIGKTEYDFIKSLFETRDRDNILLGMTMLANSNFTTSAGYAGILLSDYYHNIACNKYFNSVAFKNLLSFLKFNKYHQDSAFAKVSRYDKLTEVLIEKKLLTDEVKDLLEKKVLEIYLSLNRSKYFQPSEFKCVEEPDSELKSPEEISVLDELWPSI